MPVFFGVRRILIAGQELHAARHCFFERPGNFRRRRNIRFRRDEPLYRSEIDRGTATPQKRSLIHFHRSAIQFDRLVDGFG